MPIANAYAVGVPFQLGIAGGLPGGGAGATYFEAALTTSVTPERSQDNTVTPPAAATVRMVEDHEGILRRTTASGGDLRFKGARRVENLLTASEDLSNAAWVAANATKSGATITATAANATVLQTVTRAASRYVWRCELTRVTGSGNVDLTVDGGSTWTTVAVTSSTQIFSVSTSGVTNPQCGIRLVTDADAVTMDKMQLEESAGASNAAPSEYLSSTTDYGVGGSTPVTGVKYFATVNGNSVASNVVTEAPGAAIAAATLKGYFAEPSVVNQVAAPLDFTNAAWVKVNGSVAADGEAAPDGRAVADAFTATSGNATLLDALTLGSAAHTGQIWLKRKTGSGTVEITMDGGTGWTTVAVTSTWTEFHLTQTLANPNFGIRVVTSGDAVYVWGGQVTISSNKSTIYPVGGGTRAADHDLNYHLDNFAGSVLTAGSAEMNFTAPWADTQTGMSSPRLLGRGGINNGTIFTTSSLGAPRGQSAAGTPTAAYGSGLVWNAGDTHRWRTRWNVDGDGVDEHNISASDGSTVNDDATPIAAFTTFQDAGSDLRVFDSVEANADGSVGIGYSVKGIKIWNTDKGDTWLNTV